MLVPFFNDIVGLLGALGFWPLTVFLPIQMHLKQAGQLPCLLHWPAYCVVSRMLFATLLERFGMCVRYSILSSAKHLLDFLFSMAWHSLWLSFSFQSQPWCMFRST